MPLRRWHRESSVLRGRGGEVERELSFGLVRELFEPVMRAAPAASRRRWLSGAAGAGLRGARRGARGRGGRRGGDVRAVLAARRDRRGTAGAARSQTICTGAIPSSLRWLVYLARRIDGLPVALLGATRPVEPDEGSAVEHLLSAPGVGVCRPAALGPAATRVLIARDLAEEPADAFATACHEATGGNPLAAARAPRAARGTRASRRRPRALH